MSVEALFNLCILWTLLNLIEVVSSLFNIHGFQLAILDVSGKPWILRLFHLLWLSRSSSLYRMFLTSNHSHAALSPSSRIALLCSFRCSSVSSTLHKTFFISILIALSSHLMIHSKRDIISAISSFVVSDWELLSLLFYKLPSFFLILDCIYWDL